MTQTNMTNDTVPSDVLTVQYDIAEVSVWEAFASICQELPVDIDDMIHCAKYRGTAPNGCSVLEVRFGNLDAAKGFTAVYLDCPDADDDEVAVYLGILEPNLVPA